ncbi:Ger(x)C family spore germination protein [Fictibacillus barbaricus]|uniref:Ger(X)C family spore germination protein n=1 Tax=Fictibacillus barbaricus TaxID=182136 RepID=A0ABS2ZB19_9BACL|nr:Ger(x)C family spore germination protein [Fictibacillus barbaricus]MBN3545408.1 Ger(x)C family spore germination protein [Fictibacillus barbaricus]GGB59267.1 germination protein [Fictibacillus barbaricus]
MKKVTYLLPILFLLTGCWDQTMLNQTKLITAGGFDYTKDDKVIGTAAVPQAVAVEAGQSKVADLIFSSTGFTARQTRLRLDRKVTERLEASKNQVVVFGEKAAKKDIYHLLDVFYRDPKSALNAKLAVSKGRAADVISTKFEETKTSTGVGEYLRDSIISAEESATVPKENIQTICPLMFDPGQDFALPYLEPMGDKIKTVKVGGVALFNGHKMVGTIKEPLSVVYTMMTGESSTVFMSTTKKISNKKNQNVLNYATIKVQKNKRHFSVKVSPTGEISAQIKLKTKVVVTEYPPDKLSSPTEIEKLEKALSKRLSKDAQEVINRLQKMNSDPYGVGRKMIAFHYPTWKKLDWAKEYPKTKFTASIDVNIVDSGIIE